MISDLVPHIHLYERIQNVYFLNKHAAKEIKNIIMKVRNVVEEKKIVVRASERENTKRSNKKKIHEMWVNKLFLFLTLEKNFSN